MIERVSRPQNNADQQNNAARVGLLRFVTATCPEERMTCFSRSYAEEGKERIWLAKDTQGEQQRF